MRYLLLQMRSLLAMGGAMKVQNKQRKEVLPTISMHFPEQKLFSTLDDNGVGVIICNRQLRYEALNQSVAEIHNEPIKAHLGHSLHHVLGSLAEKVAPQWETVFATGRPVRNLEVIGRMPKRSDVGRWVHNFFPLKDGGGRVTHVGCFLIEIPLLPVMQSPLSSAVRNTMPAVVIQSRGLGRRKDRHLSTRERQILQLLAEGNSNKEVSSALDISTRTVETYRARLMLKLQAPSFAHLVHYAIRNRIVEL
jgi:DNA-binding CsgD family transcriptional regulator